jgi:hypothetical protein
MYFDMSCHIIYASEAEPTQNNEATPRDHTNLQLGISITL